MRFSLAVLIFTVGLLKAPLFAAPAPVTVEIVACDLFSQTFEVKNHNGQVETIPFSRRTDFFQLESDSAAAQKQVIDPTEVQIGDQVRIRLDSNQATAVTIAVVGHTKSPEVARLSVQATH